MRVVVTGGAGFIGSNLVDALLERGDSVVAVDNLSTGHLEFLAAASSAAQFELVQADLLDEPAIVDAIAGADAVVHLAANADVRFGWDHPRRDLEQNVVGTVNVLEAMRTTGVRRLVFASTGSVYGEAAVVPTPEDCPFPRQTSLYGASKASAEGFLHAYAEGCGFRVTVLRFVSILGPRYTHGHVIDFVRQLRLDPTHLVVLGDGTQRKSYLDVTDCVQAITARLTKNDECETFNLGLNEFCTVRDSATWICERLGYAPAVRFTGGDRGWIGDNPFIFLDTTRIRSTGWTPQYTLREAVLRTVDYLLANVWLLDSSESSASGDRA